MIEKFRVLLFLLGIFEFIAFFQLYTDPTKINEQTKPWGGISSNSQMTSIGGTSNLSYHFIRLFMTFQAFLGVIRIALAINPWNSTLYLVALIFHFIEAFYFGMESYFYYDGFNLTLKPLTEGVILLPTIPIHFIVLLLMPILFLTNYTYYIKPKRD